MSWNTWTMCSRLNTACSKVRYNTYHWEERFPTIWWRESSTREQRIRGFIYCEKCVWCICYSTLVDFIILDKFNEMMEQKCSLFLVSPKVFQELVQLSSVRVLILRHFKSWGWVFFNKGEWCREHRNNFVLFKFRSQLYFYY